MGSPTLTQLGRYRILAELGRGAMGVVYAAEDPLLNRRVAIKTIIMTGDSTERADYEARFYQEAKAAGGLNHPNVVTVHDIGREGAVAYMAMELIDGIELREMMKQSRIALPLALDIIAQVADGLAFAHERGVIHRDVKPGNVMIVRGRHVKIMDFGIARMRESDIQTRAGTLLGSPKYLSPEQVSGERTDHRSDIFSLGVMLYELVTSAPPFSGSSVTRLMHNIATVTPRMPSALNVSLPAMLDLIVGKALEKPLDTLPECGGIRSRSARVRRRDILIARRAARGHGRNNPVGCGVCGNTAHRYRRSANRSERRRDQDHGIRHGCPHPRHGYGRASHPVAAF